MKSLSIQSQHKLLQILNIYYPYNKNEFTFGKNAFSKKKKPLGTRWLGKLGSYGLGPEAYIHDYILGSFGSGFEVDIRKHIHLLICRHRCRQPHK